MDREKLMNNLTSVLLCVSLCTVKEEVYDPRFKELDIKERNKWESERDKEEKESVANRIHERCNR